MLEQSKMLRLAAGLGYNPGMANGYLTLPHSWTIHSKKENDGFAQINKMIDDPEIVWGYDIKFGNFFIIDSYSFDKFKENLWNSGWRVSKVTPNHIISLDGSKPSIGNINYSANMLFGDEVFYTILQSMMKRAEVEPGDNSGVEELGSILESGYFRGYEMDEVLMKDINLLTSIGTKLIKNGDNYVIEGKYSVLFDDEIQYDKYSELIGSTYWIKSFKNEVFFPTHKTYLDLTLKLTRLGVKHSHDVLSIPNCPVGMTTDDHDLYTHINEADISELAYRIRLGSGLTSEDEEGLGVIGQLSEGISKENLADMSILRAAGMTIDINGLGEPLLITPLDLTFFSASHELASTARKWLNEHNILYCEAFTTHFKFLLPFEAYASIIPEMLKDLDLDINEAKIGTTVVLYNKEVTRPIGEIQYGSPNNPCHNVITPGELSAFARKIKIDFKIEPDEADGIVAADSLTESEVKDDIILLRNLGYDIKISTSTSHDYQYPNCWRLKVYSDAALVACEGRVAYIKTFRSGRGNRELILDFASGDDLKKILDYLGYQVKYEFDEYKVFDKHSSEENQVVGYCVLKPGSAVHLTKDDVKGFAERVRKLSLIEPDEESGILSADKLLEHDHATGVYLSDDLKASIKFLKLCGVNIRASIFTNDIEAWRLNLWHDDSYFKAKELLPTLTNIIEVRIKNLVKATSSGKGGSLIFPKKQMMLDFIDDLEPHIDCHYDFENGFIVTGYGEPVGDAMIEPNDLMVTSAEVIRLADEFRTRFNIEPDEESGLHSTASLMEGDKIGELTIASPEIKKKAKTSIDFLKAAGYDLTFHQKGTGQAFVNGKYMIAYINDMSDNFLDDKPKIEELYINFSKSMGRTNVVFGSDEDLEEALMRLSSKYKVRWTSDQYGKLLTEDISQITITRSKKGSLTDICFFNEWDAISFAHKVRERLGISDSDEETGFVATSNLLETRSELILRTSKAVDALRGIGLTVHFDPGKSLLRLEPIIALTATKSNSTDARYLSIDPGGESYLYDYAVDDNTWVYYYLNKKDAEDDSEQFLSEIDFTITEESVLVGFDKVIEIAQKFAGEEGSDERGGIEAIGSILEDFSESNFYLWQKGLDSIYPGQIRFGWTEDNEPVFGLTGYGSGYVRKDWSQRGNQLDWDYVSKQDQALSAHYTTYVCINTNEHGDVYFFFLDPHEARESSINSNKDFLHGKSLEVFDMTVIELLFNKLRDKMSDEILGLEAENQLAESTKTQV